MIRDKFKRRLISENDVVKHLYHNPNFDIANVELENAVKFNKAVDLNFSELPKLRQIPNIDLLPEQWHQQNQKQWFMPDEYANFDIAKWVLEQCNNEVELQRCGEELLEYAKRDLLPMLCYLKYLVDTLRANNIVWGVGRGSSVASFVLYKIGIHRVNSITFQLPISDFFK